MNIQSRCYLLQALPGRPAGMPAAMVSKARTPPDMADDLAALRTKACLRLKHALQLWEGGEANSLNTVGACRDIVQGTTAARRS